MTAGKPASAERAPRASRSGVAAAVVLAFAAGFGGALQLPRLCAGPPTGLMHLVCAAAGGEKNAAAVPTPMAPAARPPAAPRSPDTGAGGAGASPDEDPWKYTTHPGMGTAGFNWTQLGMSRSNNFPNGDIKHLTAEDIRERGAMWLWHTTFARSIPATIKGLASQYSDEIQHWTLDDYRRRWGNNQVVTAFSDHPNFNRGAPDAKYGRTINQPDRKQMSFNGYLDLVAADHPGEHISVQQSPSRDFVDFGLPALPPMLEELVKYTLNARNFWAATPPKVSVMHYDWCVRLPPAVTCRPPSARMGLSDDMCALARATRRQDSVLLQISGTKRFTIVDPARLQTAYPCVAYLRQLKRVAPGVFESAVTTRELDNFPLVNITHPDLERHPLFRDAQVVLHGMNGGPQIRLASGPCVSPSSAPSPDAGVYRGARARGRAHTARVLVSPGRLVRATRSAQRCSQFLVPGAQPRYSPLPHATRERLHQLHGACTTRSAAPLSITDALIESEAYF